MLDGKLTAKYDGHNKKWLFIITATGETRVYGARTGNKIIELLRAVEVAENHAHNKVNGKVGLDDHPAVGSGAVEKPRGPRGDQYGVC